MLSRVSKLKVSNRSNKREVRQLTNREKQRREKKDGGGVVWAASLSEGTESKVL